MVRGELAIGAIDAPQTWIRPIRPDRDDGAVMRIGGAAPGRRVHSLSRRKGHVRARLTAASVHPLRLRYDADGTAETPVVLCRQASHHAVARRTPLRPLAGGHQPPQRNEQFGCQSLTLRRQGATIIVLRVPGRQSAARARHHGAGALSFWHITKRHASCSMPRRTRPLPARARPFSRRREPLSSAAPVRPPIPCHRPSVAQMAHILLVDKHVRHDPDEP